MRWTHVSLLIPIAFALAPMMAAMPNEMGLHLDERPPNHFVMRVTINETASNPGPGPSLWTVRLVLPAPFPGERSKTQGFETQGSPVLTSEEVPEPMPLAPIPAMPTPLYAQAHLTPAIDAALSEAQMREVLTEAGWPLDLHEQALRVAWGESRWRPAATNGVMLGLFQISDAQRGWPGWWQHYGFDSARYAEPVENARLAWLVYQYDIARGQAPWSQWEVKPW